MAWAMVGAAAISAIGGLAGNRSAKKLQKEALALQRDELNFSKQRYQDYQSQYGGLADLVVSEAEKGVTADLGRVTSEANVDTATAYSNAKQALDNQNQRLGVNPNSGRAESSNRQLALNQALATAGNVTNARNKEHQYANEATWNRRYGVYQQSNSLITGAANNVSNSMSNMSNNMSNSANTQSQAANAGLASAASLAMQGYLNYQNQQKQPTTVPVSNIDSSMKGMKLAGTDVSSGIIYDNISSVRPPQQTVNNGSFLG